jgi:hypothetical protein
MPPDDALIGLIICLLFLDNELLPILVWIGIIAGSSRLKPETSPQSSCVFMNLHLGAGLQRSWDPGLIQFISVISRSSD